MFDMCMIFSGFPEGDPLGLLGLFGGLLVIVTGKVSENVLCDPCSSSAMTFMVYIPVVVNVWAVLIVIPELERFVH